MQQIVQIRLPIPLRIGIERQVHSRQFAREPLAAFIARSTFIILIQHFKIVIVIARGVFAQQIKHARGFSAFKHIAAPLTVNGRLCSQVFRRGDIEFAVQDGIARGIFIHIGGAMPDPLPRDKDWQLHMVFDFAHLKRCAVAVAHEVADQAAILIRRAGAAPVRYARRLHNGRVIAHVVNHPDKAVIQYGERFEQHGFQRRHARAARRCLARAGGCDFLLLGIGKRHGETRLF